MSLNSAISDEIVIVSGLPRSGTSLMMQMLIAAGMEAVTDGQRTADVSNPRGYYELEQVKQLKQDKGWLRDARGKAVKVISQLLSDLPGDENYRVVFMQRDLEEILTSQERMLAELGTPAPPRAAVAAAFSNHLQKIHAWLESQPNVRCLRISYPELIAEPQPQIEALNQFLGGGFDERKMRAAIAPDLYRNRAT